MLQRNFKAMQKVAQQIAYSKEWVGNLIRFQIKKWLVSNT